MLLFVGFCVIHRYWPLVVSFAPLCKQGYLLHLVAIVTFCCTAQNTFVLRVFCAVQPNVTSTMLLDYLILVELHKRRSYFLYVLANLVQILWVVWIPHHERSVLAFFHMILQCAFICCATCTVMLLDFSELHNGDKTSNLYVHHNIPLR